MSRRTFLESMRQEARHRGGYDSGSSTCSVVDPGDAARASAAAEPNLYGGLTDVPDRLGHYSAAVDAAGGGAGPFLSSNVPSTGPPNDAVHGDYGEAPRAGELESPHQNGHTVVISASSGAPRTFSPPPQTPLEFPHNHSQPELQYQPLEQGSRGGANSISGESSSGHYANQRTLDREDDFRHSHSQSHLSLDAACSIGRGDAPLSGNSSFTTPAATSAARRQSVSDCARRPSRSDSSMADLVGHAERSASRSRRFSHRRCSSTQPRKSLGCTSPSPAHWTAARQDRHGSISRMEASLVALQVELAAEKRSNIEAEHHITTLNQEVKRLQQENERLSREVAAAATAAHTASASPDLGEPAAGTHHAGAYFSSSTSQGNPDMVVAAAKRIEVLEARLCEMSRNMETKQRELDVKDERIRLLEHKLADQLLLYSGATYVGLMPTGLSQALQPAAVTGRDSTMARLQQQQQPRQPSRTRLKGGNINSDAGGHRSPSRLYWQAQAPDTTPAGPKVSAIRSVKAHSLHVSQSRNDDSAGSRPASPVRSRSAYRDLSGNDGAGACDEGSLIGAEPQPSSSPVRASMSGAAVNRPLSSTRSRRQATPRRPSVRGDAAWTRTRTGSIDFANNSGASLSCRSSGLSAWTRPAADTHSARRRRDNRDSAAFGDSVAGAASGRKIGDAKQPRPLDRSGSTGGPRRPSLPRRASTSSQRSATTATCEEGQRASPRRSFVASPLHRPFRDGGAGGHPMRLDIAPAAGRDHISSSAVGSTYGRAQSNFISQGSTRRGSATRSVAQQSVRSATSTRSRPQITYSADSESATVKGTTTTVVFRNSKNASIGLHSYGGSSYARDGAPLLPSHLATPGAVEATTDAATEEDADLPRY
ncbi:hypothetical protein GH5_06838 [Leishmania sp. Ghana 2012 LV757]|uniref:hypothetical protein n=1 Tax=Leishmania sp. Ghana 2012 LV757 TaxID=2803181 RepID=UPI001B3CC9F2|nr:hypothetical protein GH5_06838 [Leishmania sp. Ghana 2012 LV757]